MAPRGAAGVAVAWAVLLCAVASASECRKLAQRSEREGASIRRNKLFVVGLPKSGTTSVGTLLHSMCRHRAKNPRELYRNDGNFTFQTFADYDTVTNAGEWIYPEVDRNYPGVFTFLIARRSNKTAWLRSVKKHFCFREWGKDDADFATWGLTRFHEFHFSRVYDRYYAEVDAYFGARYPPPVDVDVDRLGDAGYRKATLGAVARAASYPWGGRSVEIPWLNQRSSCEFKANDPHHRPPGRAPTAVPYFPNEDPSCVALATECGLHVDATWRGAKTGDWAGSRRRRLVYD